MKRLRWQLRKLATRNPRLGNVEGNRLPQHGTNVFTTTYVLKDTLSSIALYTHWLLYRLTWISTLPETLLRNGFDPGLKWLRLPGLSLWYLQPDFVRVKNAETRPRHADLFPQIVATTTPAKSRVLLLQRRQIMFKTSQYTRLGGWSFVDIGISLLSCSELTPPIGASYTTTHSRASCAHTPARRPCAGGVASLPMRYNATSRWYEGSPSGVSGLLGPAGTM
jgi:hypothetical protein